MDLELLKSELHEETFYDADVVPAEEQEQLPPYVYPNGDVFDQETGEYLGNVNIKPEFHVSNIGDASWVMQKMHDAHSELEFHQLKVQSIIEQMGKEERRLKNRIEWLNMRFSGELETFTKDALVDSKAKSIRTPYGDLKYGATKGGTIKVKDLTKALEWAGVYCPEAVKIERTLLMKPLYESTVRPPDDIFPRTEAGSKFSIDIPSIVKKTKKR